jgi:hypothetical protein
MKRVYTTANGKRVNMDAIIAQNDDAIAVGNMKVNARGDQLGPGGKIEVPRDKIMQEHYKLNTPMAIDEPPQPRRREVKKDLTDEWIEPVNTVEPIAEIEETPTEPKLRGSLADTVAKNQPTAKTPVKKTGPTRI